MRAVRVSASLTALGLVLVACGGEEKKASTDTGSAAAPEPSNGCRTVQATAPKPDGGQERPRRRLDLEQAHTVAFATSCGDFTIELDPESAPRAAASFVALARDGFFDGTVFHRIVPGFVIQGGDPTATGMGGPGYKTVDRPLRDAAYTKGVVAMAKGGQEAAGTAGSQFFVVTAPDAGLPPDYAVVGEVSEGIDTVDRIVALGDPNGGQEGTPLRPVVIESATARSR